MFHYLKRIVSLRVHYFLKIDVTVRSTVVELHQKVFKISHRFFKGEKIVAEGYEIRAWTSFKEKPKAYPIPNEVREKMMPENAETVKG